MSHALVALILTYGTFLVSESLLEVSGIMATLIAGLLLARSVQRKDGPQIGGEVGFTFDVLAYAANGSVFLLVGMTITSEMFTERWLAMLIAIGAVTLVLALALPTNLDYWWTIQSMAFGVVLFTLFVQAPTVPWLIRRVKADRLA